MKISVVTPDGNFFTIDVDGTETVENIKALIEVESGILLAEQTLKFEGRTLTNSQTVASAGLKDGELVQVERHRAPIAQPQQGGSNQLANSLAAQLSQGLQAALRGGNAGNQPQLMPQQLPQAQSRIDPEAYRLYVKSSPEMLQQLLQSDPELAQAVMSEDKSKLANLLNHRAGARQRAEQERQRLEMLLERDPFNLELQRKIEEIIQQEQIDSNMEMAMEHNPESFGRVVMLYIDSEVNNTKLKAFVDSGAQQTIMSADCAKRCGIYRFLDRRFAGIAKGVGTAKIAGRVHMTTIKIGKSFFPISVTVLEDSSMDFLLGLDMLRRHQCSIDLQENVLKIGSEKVPFLGEGDLPMHLRDVNNPQPGDELRSSGSLPAPATSAQPGASSAAPTQVQFPAEVVKSLEDMGFSRAQVLEALVVCGGDADAASNYLLSQ